MWSFVTSTEFPETGEYLEKLYPINYDDVDPGFMGAVEFKFRMHRKSKGQLDPIPGLEMIRDKEYMIESKPNLPMKPGDEIRFNKSDESIYTIITVEYIVDQRNENEYLFTSQSFPGFVENSKILLITLK